MKNISFALLFCFAANAASAQKMIEKTFNYSDKKEVNLKLQIADSIRINTWSKNEVSVKASVSIADNRYNDEYIVRFDESKDAITVDAKIESKRKNNWNEDSNCCKTDIYWDIFVPEKAPINVETINGNIVITGKTAEVKANSISGFIDLLIPSDLKADFKLSTITGTVYSNILDKESISSKKGSADISSRYKGGGTEVYLKTISGDIFLRSFLQK
jgi:predicted membrane protein